MQDSPNPYPFPHRKRWGGPPRGVLRFFLDTKACRWFSGMRWRMSGCPASCRRDFAHRRRSW